MLELNMWVQVIQFVNSKIFDGFYITDRIYLYRGKTFKFEVSQTLFHLVEAFIPKFKYDREISAFNRLIIHHIYMLGFSYFFYRIKFTLYFK